MEKVLLHFPHLSSTQIDQFQQLQRLYAYWNERINVISRKDIDHLYVRHVLHSLAIAKYFQFEPKSKILDVGTGGGFPGIPLAIIFPDSLFHLVDSIGKKIKVVKEVAKALDLKNCTAEQIRAEDLNNKYDYIVSRAVAQLPVFYQWVKNKFNKKSQKPETGIIYLKGGDLSEELKSFSGKYKEIDISDFYTDPFFETKKIIHLKQFNFD